MHSTMKVGIDLTIQRAARRAVDGMPRFDNADDADGHGTIGAAQEASRKPESQTDEASTFSAKPTETLRRESVAQSKNDCAIARSEAAEIRGGKCGEQSITTASDVRRTSVR